MQAHPIKTPFTLDSQIPISSAAQAQGDIILLPAKPPGGIRWQIVPSDGREVLARPGSSHAHFLLPGASDYQIAFGTRMPVRISIIGYLLVPDRELAYLMHTHEHHPLGIGPGLYEICRKREHGFEPGLRPGHGLRTHWVND